MLFFPLCLKYPTVWHKTKKNPINLCHSERRQACLNCSRGSRSTLLSEEACSLASLETSSLSRSCSQGYRLKTSLRRSQKQKKKGCITQKVVKLFPRFRFIYRHDEGPIHTPSIAFRHLPPNSARFSCATEGALFISAQLSTDAVSTLRKLRVLI